MSGLLPYVAGDPGGAGPLTLEDIEAAMAALEAERPVDPCRRGAHVVHARALYRPGLYLCGFCGSPVRITIPLSELVP